MTWFRIDPVALAIIESLESQPERWRDGVYFLWLDTDDVCDARVRLWKSTSTPDLDISEPPLSVDKRSRRALKIAYERWQSTQSATPEQKNRALILAALEQREGGE